MECELEVPFNCKIKSLFIKNNTQENKINLLSNKNTFYFEYKNNPNVYYLDKTNMQNYLSLNISINCTDQEAFDYNYTVTLGDIKQEQIQINISDYLNEHSNYTKFDYFIEEKGLTVGLPTEVYLKFKLFDMNSVMPLITLYYPLVNNTDSNNNNLASTNKKHNVNSKFSVSSGVNNSYGYDLFIMNSDTIRNFICEDFECDENHTIEQIIESNYLNSNYYINFSKNLMSYLTRKGDKRRNDDSSSFDYLLKDGLKFSKVKDTTTSSEISKNANGFKDSKLKEKIRNFLYGVQR